MNLIPPQNQHPLLNQTTSLQLEGHQASPYLTREDIVAILLKARKVESFAYIDTRPPYPEEMARKPYCASYTPLIFLKYNGMIGNAIEHIRRYMDALTAHSHDYELRLREFSKSLEGQALTWYTSLLPGLVLSWNDLVTQLMKKFFRSG